MDAARRQRDKLERRSRIIDAAEQVFLHTTVEHATMDQIAHAASVSKGSLYLYFKDKDDLYLSVALRAVDGLLERERIVQEQMREASGYAWFQAGLRCYADYALEFRDRFRVAMSWLSVQTPLVEGSPTFGEYKSKIAQAFQFGVDALERGKRDGSVRADLDTALSLFNLWGGLVGLLLMLSNSAEVARRIPFQVDFEKALECHLETLLASVHPRHGSPVATPTPDPELARSGVRLIGPRERAGLK